MEITRDVILDLLPLYLAGEVSEDTRSLVENYLVEDPKLAAIAARFDEMELENNIQVPLDEENEMIAYKEAKRSLFWRTLLVAVVLSLIALAFACFGVAAFMFLIPAG